MLYHAPYSLKVKRLAPLQSFDRSGAWFKNMLLLFMVSDGFLPFFIQYVSSFATVFVKSASKVWNCTSQQWGYFSLK